MSKFIIGDIHGCARTFLELVRKLPTGNLQDIVLVGDLIDRGPRSKDVVEFVMENNVPCVLGNHEQMLLDWIEGEEYRDGIWEMNGGVDTLKSYGEDNKIPFTHVRFIKSLPLFLEYPDSVNDKGDHLLVTHSSAGNVWGQCSPENPIFKKTVTWDRNSFPPKIDGIYNVFGHTPREVACIKPYWANVDTGAVFKRGLYGKLTALQFPEMKIYQQENID